MQRNKDNYLMIGLLLAMVLAAGLIVYLPQNRKLNHLQAQITSQQLALQSESEKAAVVPQIQRQVQELKSRYRNFDRRLPKQKELGEFLKQISEKLTDEQLSSQLIEPGKPTREELFHTLPIIMKFKGSFPAMAMFLKRIEGMERVTRVQKMSIINDHKDKDKDEGLAIEVQMNIYFTES